MARVVQMSTLPATMPAIPGYDVYGTFEPAELTGGDTFDLALLDQGLLVVLGDATGHGIAPALSVTQMQAMLRMAFRLGADLETAFMQVNNQLAETLPDDRFITAFIGLLDPSTHQLRFHSGGQGPILHFQAATRRLCALQADELSAGGDAAVDAAPGGGPRDGAGRHPGPPLRRHLRVWRRRRRAVRRGAGRGTSWRTTATSRWPSSRRSCSTRSRRLPRARRRRTT